MTARLVRRANSFRYAAAGIVHVARTQPNFRIQLTIGALAVALAAAEGLPARDWALLVVTIGLVLVLEMLNTVVEAVVDLASPEIHPLARTAKDAAAGAVLVASIGAVLVGVLLLGPRLLRV